MWIMLWCAGWAAGPAWAQMDALALLREQETRRQRIIAQARESVVAVFGQDPGEGGGSGVILSTCGQTLTNFHVVAAAGWQGVAGLPDGRLLPWRLVGVDPGGDLALIRLQSDSDLPVAELGDDRGLLPGMWVMAMGNGFNLATDHQPGVSLGIISGIERFQEGEGGGNLLRYGHCLQVDAAINPGNSGGPLFDMQGNVVGIVGRASFAERGRVNVGLGYAISAQQVRRFLPRLRAGGLAHHGRIGATFADRGGKVVCDAIEPDSPAAGVGLRVGDQLLQWNGTAIRSAHHYAGLASTYPSGASVEMVWAHQGQWRSGKVILAKEEYDAQALGRLGWPPPVEAWDPPANAVGQPISAFRFRPAAIDPPPAPWPDLVASSLGKVVRLRGGAIGMEVGYASGILVGPRGEILAALSAMTSGQRVTVTLSDGSEHRAVLEKRSDELQAVLLRIPAETPLFFKVSDALEPPSPGDWVLALTHAFGVAQGAEPASVNLGVVSWQGRLDLRRRMIDLLYSGPVLVVDAGISNPGAAGGAVIDAQGRLAGMVGKMVEHQQTGTRLNYAIPIAPLAAWLQGHAEDIAAATVPQEEPLSAVPTGGAVDLGIRLFTQGGDSSPAYVERVVRSSPAARAGLLPEDLLLSIDGVRVTDVQGARKLLARPPRGSRVPLVIRRGRDVLALEIEVP